MKTYELIKKRRKELGLTQEDLARCIESSKTAISRIEKAESKVTVDRLIEIAAALHTTPAELLQDTAPTKDSLTGEEVVMLSLYTQLNSVEKKQILQLMQLTVKKRKTREALLAGKAE